MLLFLTAGACQNKATETPAKKRESILDRVVVIEPELITEVPKVSRWCDRLDLVKQRINVGDAELYVEEEGKGTPLILINGGPGGTHHYFHPWFSRAKDYARVLYYDQRGCGLSDFKPGENGYSVGQAISDLDAIRKAKKIDKWVVLGYSYGGFLAQYYTINYPEHVAGLILLGTSPGMRADTGRSRQGQFLSDRERARMKEINKELKQLNKKKDLPRKEYIQILLYNNFINGDWKRQGFYKPSRERIARIALYEWDHDNNFNSILNDSRSRIDLTGAFALNPVPTLILEGKWDLTWGKKKPGVMRKNHPNARMVLFENAGHGIYDEATDKFFAVLKDFIQHLPRVPEADIAAYKAFLADWNKKKRKKEKESPGYFLKGIGWGQISSKKLVETYSRGWLDKFKSPVDFLRTGFGLYDFENYQEALFVFERMQAFAEARKDVDNKAVSLIWQGHMLDLLGKRDQAVSRYRQVKEMNITVSWMHAQYGIKYQLSPYAGERLKTPFKRIENSNLD
jgi:proline iminopeptidase